MKERILRDDLGNVRIQQWADKDYPPEYKNEDDLNAFLNDRLGELRTFRDLPNPVGLAAVVAVLKVMCQVLIALIRLQQKKLEGTD